jgi:glycosyltransferase involved in cell wall biosynthesis
VLTVAVQLFYYVYFYSRILFYTPAQRTDQIQNGPPVSIIVCAHNERENLKKLIPELLNQKYRDFELIIADDRSNDGSFDYFSDLYKGESRFRMIRIEATPIGINPKKYALTKAIESANLDWVLLTDADCIPVSSNWITQMTLVITENKKIVIGYSPYEQRSGFLNMLIQYETLYTAIQYLSFTMAGIPYMAVGRNVLYQKALFFENNGFSSHAHITGGDDDLFIRDVATKNNVACCLSKESYVYSKPKENFNDWFIQKRRHLSVGVKYRLKHKIVLGVQLLAHIGFYSLLCLVFIRDIELTFLILMIRSLGFMLIFVLIARKLSSISKWIWLLLVIDVVFIFIYLLITTSIVFYKRIKWN